MSPSNVSPLKQIRIVVLSLVVVAFSGTAFGQELISASADMTIALGGVISGGTNMGGNVCGGAICP